MYNKKNSSQFYNADSLLSIRLFSICLLFGFQLAVAQKKDENIGTEVVNVVKAYTPTISDAFKVKESPVLTDEDNSKKEAIQYSIFSFPVASTFTPTKGKSASVENAAKEKLFGNYATFAAGTYGTINAELFATKTLKNGDYVGAMFRHLSSQGGVKDVVLDNNFSNTSLDATYGSKSGKISWNAELGYQRQGYNWYGLNPLFYENLVPSDKDLFLSKINPKQVYQNVYLGGKIAINESAFKEATLKFSHFSDSYASAENRLVIKPAAHFEISDIKLKTNFVLDYLSGSFDNDYFNTTSIKYGSTILGIQPTFNYFKKELSINFGLGIYYNSLAQTEISEAKSKLFIYPNITGSFNVVGDLMIAYAGLEGELIQNSYPDFVQENFFMSPTSAVSPTDQKYDLYLGLKGKLSNTIGYNVRGSFKNEENKALYKSNAYNPLNTNASGYAFGNSFGIIYDKVKTLSFFGELKADFTKNFSVGVNGTLNSYGIQDEQEAWNLPAIQLSSFVDYTFNSKWYASAKVFFVGQRKDVIAFPSLANVFPPMYSQETTTLNSYFDLNAQVGCKHSERLTFFFKGNNLANQNYQRWANYPVQGIQVMLGANYKFDF
jgi:hypothetical protein